MFKILFTSACMLFSSVAYADSTHSLGFAAGSTYGIGLSYSYDNPTWGVQITGLPVWDESDGGRIAGGVNFKRNFHENGRVGLYGSLGMAGHLYRDIYEEYTWDPETDEETSETVIDEGLDFAAGPGVGMQVMFWDNLLFRFELPLAVKWGTNGLGIIPIPNSALMYRW